MFEQETENIIDAIRQRILPRGSDQSAIVVKDILAADIPLSMKIFFRADVEMMLEEELLRHRKTSSFNFDHPEIQSLQNQINSVVVLRYSYSGEEFTRRLNDTVHLLINYLIRPQWALTHVLFEKEPSISTAALTRMLRYFGPYPYLRDLIVRYVGEKKTAAFTQKEFATLLWKLDGEYIRRKTGEELATMISPMYEFFDFPRNTGAKGLPIKALQKFFDDKRLIAVLHRLEGELAQGAMELTHRQLADLLEDVRRTVGSFEVEKSQTEEITPPVSNPTP